MTLTTPGRQSAIGHNPRQLQSADGGLLGRLDDRDAARRQRRGDSAREHIERHIPRQNVRGDSDRLAQSEIEIAARSRDRRALNFVGDSGVKLEIPRRPRDRAARRRRRLAGFARFHRRQFVGALFDGAGDAHQKAPALDRRGFRPRPGERAAGGAHGFVGFGGVGAGDFGDDRFVAGIDRRQNAAGAARTPFAVDKKAGRD